MKIATAYDAYWFLYEHPKMQCREALILTAEHSAVLDKGERIRTVKDEMPWLPDATYQIREFKFTRRALDMNLDVFCTKVDEKRRVNDDPKKNKFVACWLNSVQFVKLCRKAVFTFRHTMTSNLTVERQRSMKR